LILLVIVRLGAAWARHLEKWLVAESRNKVDQRHKSRAGDSTTDPTVNSRTDSKDHIVDGTDSCRLGIDRTDRELGLSDSILDNISDNISDFTDPILDATGRTDCTKLTDVRKCYMSDCEGLQYTTFPQLSALPATQLTSDNQKALQETPLSQTMLTTFYILMPLPGTLGSPIFEGANATEFLERYDDLCSDYQVSEKDRLTRLPRYCIQPIAETIRSLNE
jgi:hypothetical protein